MYYIHTKKFNNCENFYNLITKIINSNESENIDLINNLD